MNFMYKVYISNVFAIFFIHTYVMYSQNTIYQHGAIDDYADWIAVYVSFITLKKNVSC